MNFRSVLRTIGLILLLIAAAMTLPVIVALIYGENDVSGITISLAVTGLAGVILVALNRRRSELDLKDGFAIVTFGWLAMTLCSALPYLFTGSIPSLSDAWFESASGLSTTGATILSDIEALPHGILFWRSLTHWIGGMGIIVLSVAILPFLGVGGMQMFKAEAPGPTKDKLTPRIRDTASLLWGLYAGFTLLETILLMLGGMDWFDASCHAFGTLATGGFSTRNASLAAFDSAYLDYVVVLFMYIAGTSFTLHYYAVRGNLRKYWQSVEFRLYTGILVLFSLVATIVLLIGGLDPPHALRQATFNVVSLGTATGFANADYELWPILPQLLIVAATVMGGMAGSTSGGLKSMRVYVLFAQAKTELHRLIHPTTVQVLRMGDAVVTPRISTIILAFFFLYMLMAAAGTILLGTFGVDPVTGVTASFACLSNAGPGLGTVGPAENYGHLPFEAKWVLSFLMIAGRLEFFTVLVMFTRKYWEQV